MKYGAVLLKQMVFVCAMLVGVYLFGGSMFLLSCILLRLTRAFIPSDGDGGGEFVTALSYNPRIIQFGTCYYLHAFPYPLRLIHNESAIIKMAKRIKY